MKQRPWDKYFFNFDDVEDSLFGRAKRYLSPYT